MPTSPGTGGHGTGGHVNVAWMELACFLFIYLLI
jgi:hypothetical protein